MKQEKKSGGKTSPKQIRVEKIQGLATGQIRLPSKNAFLEFVERVFKPKPKATRMLMLAGMYWKMTKDSDVVQVSYDGTKWRKPTQDEIKIIQNFFTAYGYEKEEISK